MARQPAVISPLAPLFRREGVGIALVSVELWPRQTIVRRIYRDVSLALSDDVGTTYRWKSSAVGGTGRLFRGDWHFPRGVPEEATRLVVEASDRDGDSGSYELTLE